MTGQQEADALLAEWQANRHLAPRERLELVSDRFDKLLFDFFQGPLPTTAEYEATLRTIAEYMAAA